MGVRAWVAAAAVVLAAACTGDPADPAATPTVPVLPADLAVLAAAPATGLAPVTGELRGPHFVYSLAAAGTVRTAPAGLGLPAGAVPAPGHDLFLAELAPTPTERPPYDGTPDAVEVVAGSTVVPVRTGGAPATGGGTLAVSVPTGSAPVLRVTDAGRRQSLELRTGRRGPDAIAGYHPPVTGSSRPAGADSTLVQILGPATATLAARDRTVIVRLDDLGGALQPWTPERSWARAGRAWLVLRPKVGYTRPNTDEEDAVTVAPDAFTVTGPAGARIAVAGEPIRLSRSSGTEALPNLAEDGTGELTADVPATLRGPVTVRFAFRGTIVLPAGPATPNVYANPVLTSTVLLG